MGNFDPNSPTGLIQVGESGVSSPYNSDPKDFAPRFGFAWDVTGKGNTVVRGGAGLMYETVNWESFLAFNNSFGLTNIPTGAIISGTGTAQQATAGGTITAGNLAIPPILPQWDSGAKLYGDLSSSQINCDPNSANPCPIMSVVRNLTTPYVWNWTLNVQHAFTPNLSLELGYVGNHGSNLTGIRDINQEMPGADAGNGQATRPFNTQFRWLSNIFQMGNFYRSNYNGLQATLNSRNYHGLSMVMGYTYSHALDDVGANWDFGAGYGLPQDSTNVGARIRQQRLRHPPAADPFSDLCDPRERRATGRCWRAGRSIRIATIESSQPWGPIDLTTDLRSGRPPGQPAASYAPALGFFRQSL